MRPYTATELCQLDGRSCFGCCGRKWGTKEEVLSQIQKNTDELVQIKERTQFRLRSEPDDLPHGSCRNLVYDGTTAKTCCPLHPARNEGKDLRVGHCDIYYLCPTAKKFNVWERDKQERFIAFLRKHDDKVYEYSMKMDQNWYLKQFKKEEQGEKLVISSSL
ncbi:hypothetical protein J4410_06560 [Candidatus Woesearchaeota archaeon]|nr:hypothetical protein [Candidatus Woesearchaeota archaeon]